MVGKEQWSCLLLVVAMGAVAGLLVGAEAVEVRGCDEMLSREARAIIRDVVLNAVQDVAYEMPESCLFHPARDLLQPFDAAIMAYRSKYRCSICKLTDRDRYSLLDHVVEAHGYLIDDHGGDLCLADYCDMLECPSVKDAAVRYRAGSACSDAEMQRRRFDCSSALISCFPPTGSDVAHELHSAFDRIFCRRQRCGYVEPSNEYHAELYDKYVNAAEGAVWFWVKVGLLVTVVVSISVYYVAIWLWSRELKMEEDMKRLSRRPSKLTSLTTMFTKPKVKGY